MTLLAIFNDPDHVVEVFMDKALWASEAFNFHPLVNTSTLVISRQNIERFIQATGHEIQIVDVPEQN